MRLISVGLIACAFLGAQTKENLVPPVSSAPAASLAKSGDIGGGKYAVSVFDPGRRLVREGLTPPTRTTNRYTIAVYRLVPLASLSKSGDIGGGKYTISVFDPGLYLFKNIVWYASGAGPPLTPPARDGINNPLVFR